MLTLKHGFILTLFLLVLTACTPDDDNDTGKQSTILKDQMKTLDKARDVEQVLKDSAEERRQAADQ